VRDDAHGWDDRAATGCRLVHSTWSAAPPPKAQKKAVATKSKVSGESPFEVGEEVEGFFDEDNEWYGAKVTKLQKEGGKVQVVWDDDDGEKYDLEPGYIRKKISNVDRNGPFQAGEAVMAYCHDDGSVYPGIIQQDNGDGSFSLLWDEDGSAYTCKDAEMRKVAPMLDEGELELGMKVRGQITSVREWRILQLWRL